MSIQHKHGSDGSGYVRLHLSISSDYCQYRLTVLTSYCTGLVRAVGGGPADLHGACRTGNL